jgi:hypothetical protein
MPTRYDAVCRRHDARISTEDGSGNWHTLLNQPKVVPVKIDVPVGLGYVLTSKKTGRMLAMVDLRFMQQELFRQLPKDATPVGTLVLAVARDTTYYVNADATQCCRWGACGIDTSAGARSLCWHVSGLERGGRGRRRAADYPTVGAVLPRPVATRGTAAVAGPRRQAMSSRRG